MGAWHRDLRCGGGIPGGVGPALRASWPITLCNAAQESRVLPPRRLASQMGRCARRTFPCDAPGGRRN